MFAQTDELGRLGPPHPATDPHPVWRDLEVQAGALRLRQAFVAEDRGARGVFSGFLSPLKRVSR